MTADTAFVFGTGQSGCSRLTAGSILSHEDIGNGGAMRVEVKYDVPVSAWVDLEAGEIEGVYVWCEGIEQRDDEYAIVTLDKGEQVIGKEATRAQEVVDSVIWPEWGFR
jgi:hypothetical protein